MTKIWSEMLGGLLLFKIVIETERQLCCWTLVSEFVKQLVVVILL